MRLGGGGRTSRDLMLANAGYGPDVPCSCCNSRDRGVFADHLLESLLLFMFDIFIPLFFYKQFSLRYVR